MSAGVMQCYRLVRKDGFSAWNGTAGEWRLLCGERVDDVRYTSPYTWEYVPESRVQTTGAANEKLRWMVMDLCARETNRSPRPAERSDRRDKSETNPMRQIQIHPPIHRIHLSTFATIIHIHQHQMTTLMMA